MPTITPPDADAAAALHGARVDAHAALQGRFPDVATPIPPPSAAQAMAVPSGTAPAAAAAPQSGPPAAVPSDGPPADAGSWSPPGDPSLADGPPADIQLGDLYGEDGPPADIPPPVDSKTTPSMFAGLGSSIGNGLMRGFVGMGRVIGLAGGALASGDQKDAYFRGLDNLVDSAMQYWQPSKPVGTGSQVAGQVAEGLAPMLTGDAGMVVNAGINSAADSVKQGEDLKTAAKIALVSAGATAAGLRLPLKSPVFWKRIAIGALGNTAISDGAKALVHKILGDNGYQQAAAQVNWADPQQNAVDGLMGAIFGAVSRPELRGKIGNAAAAKPPAPIVGSEAGPEPDINIPEFQPPQPVAPVAPEPVTPPAGEVKLPGEPAGEIPAPAVPDTPSAEPVADLKAQIADMQDPKTRRKAVYLSPENVQTLGPEGVGELAQNMKQIRNFDKKGGVLIVPDAAAARAARDLRAAEPDMQKVLGKLTGAGDGKTPDKTAVVQGQTPEGAVASESTVNPADIPAAVAQEAAEGKTPVVTTPEAAIERRAQGVAADQAQTTEAQPVGETVRPWSPDEQRAAEANRIAQLEVRHTIRHAAEPGLYPTATLPEPARAKSDLERSMDTLTEQEKPAKGRKLVPMKQRLENVSAAATMLKAATAKASELGKPDSLIKRASDAWHAGEILGGKTEEQIGKSQGVTHQRVSAVVAEMQKVSRLLEGRGQPGDEEAPLPTRAAVLKARVAKRAEAAAAPAPAPSPTKPEPVGDENTITVKPHIMRGREITAFREMYGDERNPNEGWLPYIAALNPAHKESPFNKSEHIQLGNLVRRFAIADAAGAGEARDNLDAFMGNVRGKKLDAKTQAAVHEYAQEMRRMEQDRQHEDSEEDTEPGESVEDHGESDEPTEDELQQYGARVYSDRLWGKTEKDLDDAGFGRALEKMHEAGTPASLHGILDILHKRAANPVARAVISAIRGHVTDKPVYFMKGQLRTQDGRDASPNTAGLHEPHRIQVRIDHPLAHPVRTLMHEAVHAVTSAHLKEHPESEFSQEIERLRQVAARRIERMEMKSREPALLRKRLYGLKNSREFLAEALSSDDFQKLLIESEKFAAPGEGIRGVISHVGRAIRKLLGFSEDAHGGALLDNVLWGAHRVMNAQAGHADTSTDILADALETGGKPFRGERRVLKDLPEGVHALVRGIRELPKTAIYDRVAKGLRGLQTYDQLIDRGQRFFGLKNSHTNPLLKYDATQRARRAIGNRLMDPSRRIAQAWARLPLNEDTELGNFMRDTTLWGVDPRVPMKDQPKQVQKSSTLQAKHQEFTDRWNALSDAQRQVYTMAENDNRRLAARMRKAAVDIVNKSYELNLPQHQLDQLYGVKRRHEFNGLIGQGKAIDLGEKNGSVTRALHDIAGLMEREGPYFHLGREGSKVVQVKPEGTKHFGTEAQAKEFARHVEELAPGNTADVVPNKDGSFDVDYEVHYVSMHNSAAEAEEDAARMRGFGFDVGPVTEKTLSEETVPLTQGLTGLMSEAQRKLVKSQGIGAPDATTDAMLHAMQQAYVKLVAARSSYGRGRLTREGFAGVKGHEMRGAYGRHATSMAYHIAHLDTMYDEASALGRLKEAERNPEIGNADQGTMYMRGRLVHEIQARIQQESRQQGMHPKLNSTVANAGFWSFIASASHLGLWMLQNPVTGIPTLAHDFGLRRSASALGKGMRIAASPILRSTVQEAMRNAKSVSPQDVAASVVAALKQHPELAKYGSQLEQLGEQGALGSSLTMQLNNLSQLDRNWFSKSTHWAMLWPHMVDLYNRVSTSIAGLDLTGGDAARTARLVSKIHANYDPGNAPRYVRMLRSIPGGNALTMLSTYSQAMTHLLYEHVHDAIVGNNGSRAQAAKTVAGLLGTTALAAGVRGAMPAPVTWGVQAYQKLFGDKNEFHDMDTSIRDWAAEMFGRTGGQVVSDGLPTLADMDLSDRIGYTRLPFMDAMGPFASSLEEHWGRAQRLASRGQYAQALLQGLPVKAVNDIGTAFELPTQGYQTNTVSAGPQNFGAWDALVQGLGFKPASLSNLQQKANTAYEYRRWAWGRKQAILDQFVQAQDKAPVMEQIGEWNRQNPGVPITRSEIIRSARSRMFATQLGSGQPGRDPQLNRLTNY